MSLRWTPVSEGLPGNNKIVSVSYWPSQVATGYRNDYLKDGCFILLTDDRNENEIIQVQGWQPLPKPYNK